MKFWKRSKKDPSSGNEEFPQCFYSLIERLSPAGTRITDGDVALTGLNTLVLMEVGLRPLSRDVEEAFRAAQFLAATNIRACSLLDASLKGDAMRDAILTKVAVPLDLMFSQVPHETRLKSVGLGAYAGLKLVSSSQESGLVGDWLATAWKAVDAVVLVGSEAGIEVLARLYPLMPLPQPG